MQCINYYMVQRNKWEEGRVLTIKLLSSSVLCYHFNHEPFLPSIPPIPPWAFALNTGMFLIGRTKSAHHGEKFPIPSQKVLYFVILTIDCNFFKFLRFIFQISKAHPYGIIIFLPFYDSQVLSLHVLLH